MHREPQLIPADAAVTTPDPVPAFTTERTNVCNAKLAVAVLAASIGTVHVGAVPAQAPVQPVNVDPVAGAAVSVTLVPST